MFNSSYLIKIQLRKGFFDNLKYDIKHDQQNIKILKCYSIDELKYIISHGISINLQRINLKNHNFFGENTAVFSMITLTTSIVQNMGGSKQITRHAIKRPSYVKYGKYINYILAILYFMNIHWSDIYKISKDTFKISNLNDNKIKGIINN